MRPFGIIVILFLVPLEFLSGDMTPQNSIPKPVQRLIIAALTTVWTSRSRP